MEPKGVWRFIVRARVRMRSYRLVDNIIAFFFIRITHSFNTVNISFDFRLHEYEFISLFYLFECVEKFARRYQFVFLCVFWTRSFANIQTFNIFFSKRKYYNNFLNLKLNSLPRNQNHLKIIAMCRAFHQNNSGAMMWMVSSRIRK